MSESALAGLAVTLLLEQGHVENLKRAEPLNDSDSNWAVLPGSKAYVPLVTELGNQVENALTGGDPSGGGAVVRYMPASGKTKLMSFRAFYETTEKQRQTLKNAKGRLKVLFPKVTNFYGVLYDSERKINRFIDVDSGKQIEKPE